MTTPRVAAFVPRLVARAAADDAPRPRRGAASALTAAVAFADLTDFTPLTERLQREGPRGVEALAALLDGIFGAVVGAVHDTGGDVLRFVGDALILAWPVAPGEAPADAVARACAASRRAGRALRDVPAPEGIELRLKVGVGFGEVRVLDVGGASGRWDFVAVGDPLLQMARAEHAAAAGEVVLSPEAAAASAGSLALEPAGDGCARLVGDVPATPRAPEPADGEDAPGLRAYLPDSVLRRIDAGQGGWLAEFRDITSVFVSLPDADLARGDRDDDLRRAVEAAAAPILAAEGNVSQVVVDDKGLVVVAAFGLPLLAHDDDAARAVGAALEIHRALAALGARHRVGLASGFAFCGACGAPARREFVAIGNVANLAARLMQRADGVLCDDETARRARAGFAFESLPPARVKGRSEPVALHRPLGPADGAARDGAPLVGRAAERERLAAAVAALLAGGPGGALTLVGDGGIGKSALLAWLADHARAAGLVVLAGAAEREARDEALHAFRGPLLARLGLDPGADPDARRDSLRAFAFDDRALGAWRALLDPVLGTATEASAEVREMSPALRGRNALRLAAAMLSGDSPRLVVVDDAHWMDASSRELARDLARRPGRTLLVLAARPGEDPPLDGPGDAGGAPTLAVGPLPRGDAEALLCRCLAVDSLDPALAEAALAKVDGHPFLLEQVALTLREGTGFVVTAGRGHLAPGRGPGDVLPEGLSRLVTGRIDRLAADDQLTLKVAAVIGATFTLAAVAAAHPVRRAPDALEAQLRRVEAAGVTRAAADPGGPAWTFCQSLLHEAAYGMLVFSQRRELHRAAAAYLEREGDASLAARAGRHWEQAEEPVPAARAYGRGADLALARGASREAMALYHRARTLLPAGVDGDDPRPAWLAGEAEAGFAAGELDACEEAAALALRSTADGRLLGWGGLGVAAVAQIVRQLAHLALGLPRVRARGEARRARFAVAARAYGVMAERAYHVLDPGRYLVAALAAVNAAERAGETALVPRAYSLVSHIAGALGLDRLRRRWFDLGMAAAPPAQVPNLLYGLGIYHFARGELARAREVFEDGLQRARRINDRREMCVGILLRNNVQVLVGADPDDLRVEAAALAAQEANRDHPCWTHLAVAGVAAYRDEAPRARESLAASAAVVGRAHVISWLCHESIAALVELVDGRPAEALAHLARYADLAARQSAVDQGLLGPLLAALEVARRLDHDDARRAVDVTRAHLTRVARLAPLARSRAERAEGLARLARGEAARAQARFERAMALARAQGNALDAALAEADLAFGLSLGGEAARASALRALEDVGHRWSARMAREGRWVKA